MNKLNAVHHGDHGLRTLKELGRSYLTMTKDQSRVMSRIKAIYRSWAIPCSGKQVYGSRHRADWLGKILEPGVHSRAELYYQQLEPHYIRSLEIAFNLLQGLTLRFRNPQQDEEEAAKANSSVHPECPCGSDFTVQDRESECQNKRRYPERRNGYGNCQAANAIREDFRYQDPCDRSERQRIESNRAESNYEDRKSLCTRTVRKAKNGVRQSNCHATENHQGAASKVIHQSQRNHREHKIDGPCDYNVEQSAADSVARTTIDFFGVVENDVDATPLLQDCKDHADQHDP